MTPNYFKSPYFDRPGVRIISKTEYTRTTLAKTDEGYILLQWGLLEIHGKGKWCVTSRTVFSQQEVAAFFSAVVDI